MITYRCPSSFCPFHTSPLVAGLFINWFDFFSTFDRGNLSPFNSIITIHRPYSHSNTTICVTLEKKQNSLCCNNLLINLSIIQLIDQSINQLINSYSHWLHESFSCRQGLTWLSVSTAASEPF